MSFFMGKAGKALFERHLEQYAPVDPMYEYYTTASGKQKKRKRDLPPGLSKRDAKILKSVKKRAHRLDKGFSLCGLRFGWTFIIGMVPGVGDAADALLNYQLVVRKAKQAEIPPWLYHRMLFNNAVSAGIGFVPVAGDVFIAVWKANSRNAALLEEFLRVRGEEYLRIQEGHEITANATASSSAVNAHDASQVKPGAGKQADEIIADGARRQKAFTAATAGRGNNTTLEATGSGPTPPRRFWSWKSSDKVPRVGAPALDKGKFIENVGS